MKTYPTISGLTPKIRALVEGCPVYLFRKEDGSNIRAEWNPNKGFYKYGRRNGLLDDSNPVLKEAPELFLDKYGEHFERCFRKTGKIESAIVYFEFFGNSSRFGNHKAEQHTVQAFDINIHKRGFLPPALFIKMMGDLNTGLVWRGKFNQDILDQVRDGSLPGISFEGVVGKEEGGTMFKYKCQRWYDALKEHCGDNQDLYNILK